MSTHTTEGTISKERNGYKWRMRTGNGSVVRRAKTLAEVKEKRRIALHEFHQVKVAEAAYERSLAYVMERWLESGKRAAKTNFDYRRIYERYTKPAIGDVPADGVDAAVVSRLVAYVQDAEGGDRSATRRATLRVALQCVCTATGLSMRQVRRWGVLPDLASEPRDTMLNDDDEVRAFLHELHAPVRGMGPTRLRWLFEFLLLTGLRANEALSLIVMDVSLRSCEVRVHRQWCDLTDEWKPLKGKRARVVPLNDRALEVVREQLKMLADERHASGMVYEDLGLLFPNSLGGRMNPRNVNRSLDAVCKRANVKASPHALRRTFLTMLAEHAPVAVVQQIAGHRDVQTTMRHYVRARRAASHDAVGALWMGKANAGR
jgi:integrase